MGKGGIKAMKVQKSRVRKGVAALADLDKPDQGTSFRSTQKRSILAGLRVLKAPAVPCSLFSAGVHSHRKVYFEIETFDNPIAWQPGQGHRGSCVASLRPEVAAFHTDRSLGVFCWGSERDTWGA